MKEHSELPFMHIGSQRIPSSTNNANWKATDNQLPLPVEPNAPDKANLEIIQAEEVKPVAKREQKLKEALKKGFVTV